VVRVCAWCRLFLGLKRPADRWEITHGICRSCEHALEATPGASRVWTPMPMLVVSRDPIGLEAAGSLIARAGRAMLVVADRRRSDRRWRGLPVPFDRRRGERRAPPPDSWRDGYVLVEPAAHPDLADLVLGSLTVL
jgi:hypothetical protein